MLSTRDFNGIEYHAFCQQQYDAARKFLKTCGKPSDDVDRFLIEQARLDVSVFGGALDRTDAVNRLIAIGELKKELVRLDARRSVLLMVKEGCS